MVKPHIVGFLSCAVFGVRRDDEGARKQGEDDGKDQYPNRDAPRCIPFRDIHTKKLLFEFLVPRLVFPWSFFNIQSKKWIAHGDPFLC